MTQEEKGVLPDIGTVATVEIDGLSVRYARSGMSKGTPILLTAPWPESIYSFHRVLPRLAIEYSLIAVDLPGYGRSQSRPDVMAPEAMGDFVISLLKHFGISRTHVVAPDVGTLKAECPRVCESFDLEEVVIRRMTASRPLTRARGATTNGLLSLPTSLCYPRTLDSAPTTCAKCSTAYPGSCEPARTGV